MYIINIFLVHIKEKSTAFFIADSFNKFTAWHTYYFSRRKWNNNNPQYKKSIFLKYWLSSWNLWWEAFCPNALIRLKVKMKLTVHQQSVEGMGGHARLLSASIRAHSLSVSLWHTHTHIQTNNTSRVDKKLFCFIFFKKCFYFFFSFFFSQKQII